MSTNSNSIFLLKMTRLAAQAGATGSIRAPLFGRLLRWPHWLSHRQQKKADPITTADYTLDDERYVEGGYYRISPEHVARERAIDVHSLSVKMVISR